MDLTPLMARRTFLRQVGGLVAVAAGSASAAGAAGAAGAGFTGLAFVGCYTEATRNGRGRGISVYRVKTPGAAWELVHLSEGEVNPSFLAIDRPGRVLYAVHGGDTELVSAHRIDPSSGTLTRINQQSTGGTNPVHLALDPTGRWLVVASYIGGNAAVLPVQADGSLGPRTDLVTMTGTPGPHRVEQVVAHPHHCPFDPLRAVRRDS